MDEFKMDKCPNGQNIITIKYHEHKIDECPNGQILNG